jgi:hypothetical protein
LIFISTWTATHFGVISEKNMLVKGVNKHSN